MSVPAMDELTHAAHRARDGDRQALERLVALSYGETRRLCAAVAGAEVADDLAQETLSRVVLAVRDFRGESSARTWVLAIARRVCMDELRARSRRSRREQKLMELAPPASSSYGDPSALLDVRDLLSQLEPERRAAFALTQLLRLSYEEAAVVCDCPTGTIRSRVARARDDLIRLLEPPVREASRDLPGGATDSVSS